MRALILAAGRGSRMQRLTAHRPKCLVPLAGRPLLEWQRSALQAAGVDSCAIVRGYCGQLLKDFPVVQFENPRWETTNMVATLRCADTWLSQETTLVSYADIVYHPQNVQALAQASGDIVITYDRWWKQLWSERFENPLADAETFLCSPEGRVLEIGGRPQTLEQVQGQYMGLLKITPSGWASIQSHLSALAARDVDKLDMTSLLRGLMTSGVEVRGVAVEGHWCEVDSAEDLEIYEDRLQDVIPWRHDWRWEAEAA